MFTLGNFVFDETGSLEMTECSQGINYGLLLNQV